MGKRFSLTYGRALGWLMVIWLLPIALWSGFQSGDETRVAGIAAGMLYGHEWLVPHLNGVPFLEYPPLFYWWSALFMKVFGVSEWAASLASSAVAAGSVLLVWKIVRKLGGTAVTAAAASMMLMTSAQFLDDSCMVRVDILLVFFTTLSFYGFCHIARVGESRKLDDLRGFLLLAAGIGGGIMTKGLVGAVLPASCMGTWLVLDTILSRKLCIRAWLVTAAGFAVGLIPVTVWCWMLAGREGGMGMVHTVVIVNNIGRFTGSQGDHVSPFYEYIIKLPVLFQPWLILVFAGLWALGRKVRQDRDRTALLVILYLLMPFIVLSVSGAKRLVYLLPLAPAAALTAVQGGKFLLSRFFPAVQVSLLQLPVRTWFVIFAGIGIVIQVLFIGVYMHKAGEDSVKSLWQEAEKTARLENREIVLISPPERASGAAVFYLGRTVETRREMTLSGKAELWILRYRWPDKYKKADRHRMFRIPEEYEQLKKLTAK